MSTERAHPRLVTLCQYLSPFVTEPVVERLEFWELAGPLYSLGVRQFASPDGQGEEAWISAEVTDVAAVAQLLEDWSNARRVGPRTRTRARRALARAFPPGALPAVAAVDSGGVSATTELTGSVPSAPIVDSAPRARVRALDERNRAENGLAAASRVPVREQQIAR